MPLLRRRHLFDIHAATCHTNTWLFNIRYRRRRRLRRFFSLSLSSSLHICRYYIYIRQEKDNYYDGSYRYTYASFTCMVVFAVWYIHIWRAQQQRRRLYSVSSHRCSTFSCHQPPLISQQWLENFFNTGHRMDVWLRHAYRIIIQLQGALEGLFVVVVVSSLLNNEGHTHRVEKYHHINTGWRATSRFFPICTQSRSSAS